MNIAINGLSLNYDEKCGQFKLPDGKFISQKEVRKSIMNELEKNKFNPSEFNNIYQEGTRDAKASAAFFNAKNMMPRGTEDQVKTSNNVFKKLINKVKDSKIGQNVSKLFNKAKDSKVSQNISNVEKAVVDKTKPLFTKSAVKKGLKYGAIGVAVLGGLALVGYLGKKAYGVYKDKQNAKDTTSNPASKPESKPTPVVASGVHDVKAGDNVWNIAKKDLESKGGKVTNAEIAVRTQEIMALNNLKYANDKGLVIIRPGEQIKLSA